MLELAEHPVGIWTSAFDQMTAAEARSAVQQIEDLGYSSVWLPETTGRDPFVTAALLLGATNKIAVGTGVVNAYARDALTTINAARTLDEAFSGRFALGVGVSHKRFVEGVRHHDYARPYSKMEAYLDGMEAARFSGRQSADGFPTLIAALGPRMMSLAARRTDGAHTYFSPVEHTSWARSVLGPDRTLVVGLMAVIDNDIARARSTARRMTEPVLGMPNYAQNLERFGYERDERDAGGSDRLVDAVVACGTDAFIERIHGHLDAGASHVCVQLLGEGPTTIRDAWTTAARVLDDEQSPVGVRVRSESVERIACA